MSVTYEQIQADFERLRDFALNDCEAALQLDAHGNYMIAAVVMVACEAVASLRYGIRRGSLAFAEMLPERWRPVAPSIYEALRNGLIWLRHQAALNLGPADQRLSRPWWNFGRSPTD